ncbi:MAG: hypothetical protein ABIU87_00805 [Ornithinibacter sp.]
MAGGRVLVVNAGSSSLKYEVFDVSSGTSTDAGSVSGVGGRSRHQHRGRGGDLDEVLDCPGHTEAFAAASAALGSTAARASPGPCWSTTTCSGHWRT